MSVTATVRVMSAEEIVAQGGGELPFLRFPERSTVFAERAMRLAQRAGNGHPMADYLRFVGAIAGEQQQVLAAMAEVPLPDAAALDAAALAGQPPIAAEHWPRDAAWRTGLTMLAANLRPRMPEAARPAVDRVLAMTADELERQAGRLLTGVMHGIDMAAAPVVAAALQVYWTHMLLALRDRQGSPGHRAAAFGRIADEAACPCCGSRPTAGITRSAGGSPGQRYLHCALCGLEWHFVRIRCSHCLSSKAISFQALDAAGDRADAAPGAAADGLAVRPVDSPEAAARAARAAIQAETCEDCGHYLKLMHSERDPFIEPAADDLATVALDLLVSESGYRRHGVNLMLLLGESDGDEPVHPPPDPGGG